MKRITLLIVLLVIAACQGRQITAEDKKQPISVQEFRAILDAIDPYLPVTEIGEKINVFGSTSMDTLADGWVTGFKKFHPEVQVVISAEGSETVFDRLSKNPKSIGMMSRPVTQADLDKFKELGLQQPVAIMVAREALGIFVHEKNPLQSISYPELAQLFCSSESDQPNTWSAVGIEEQMGEQPVELIMRDHNSGTQLFVSEFVFASRKLREAKESLPSNAKVLAAVEKNANAIAICSLKTGGHGARALQLRDQTSVLPSDDHAVLVGKYPLTRPFTLVLDAGDIESPQGLANREFIRYALSQAGQMQCILAGYFPFDPPTLRGEMTKVEIEENRKLGNTQESTLHR